MILHLPGIRKAIRRVIKAKYNYTVYESPQQQTKSLPCFFIFFMPSNTEGQIGKRQLRDIGVDIVFIQEPNILNRNKLAEDIADFLDNHMDMVPYGDGETVMIHTYENEWKIEDGELHYQFRIKARMAQEESEPAMLAVEDIKGGLNFG